MLETIKTNLHQQETSLFISRAAYLQILVGASLASFFHYCFFLLFSPQICLYAKRQWDWKMNIGITYITFYLGHKAKRADPLSR